MNSLYAKRIFSLILILTLIVLSCLIIVTQSRYITEMGGTTTEIGGSGNDLDNEVMTPIEVSSPLDLFNAIQNGYSYVQLIENLDAPIIMTGDTLDLDSNFTIDLNGNEIQRSSRNGLVSVSSGAKLTIIDTKGGGGLYNPTGSVLSINGGELDVFGGKYESGPRPEEYYTNLQKEYPDLYSDIPLAPVTNLKAATPPPPRR